MHTELDRDVQAVLALTTLRMALAMRQAGLVSSVMRIAACRLPPGLHERAQHPWDLDQYGAAGCPYDNAQAECFIKTLKYGVVPIKIICKQKGNAGIKDLAVSGRRSTCSPWL